MLKESLCIQVPKIHGEKTLVLANKLEISDRELEIQKNANFIYVPLIRQPSENELSVLKAQVPDFQLATLCFSRKKTTRKNACRSS